MPKTHMNISLDHDLAGFLKTYAKENRTSASEVITQFILGLKRQSQGDGMALIFSNPDFHRALVDVQSRLRDGTAEWHDYDDVFGE